METKGSDSRPFACLGVGPAPVEILGFEPLWGRLGFTLVHWQPPTPSFPMELTSRTSCLCGALISNKLQPHLDPKAYPVEAGYRERALLTYVT